MNSKFRVAAIAIFAGAVLYAVSFVGCSPKQDPVSKGDDQQLKTENPWDVAAKLLKKGKDVDLTTCKAAVGQLKDLAGREKELQPRGLAPEEEAPLVAIAPLSPDDLNEVRSATFTPLDPAYLFDCFYLRDTANKSLAATGLTPARRAEAAFAWVCRQVYLEPSLMSLGNGNQLSLALPPTYVLRRGYGSGLERAYIMLALLQQMNLDGCLIGSPDAATKEASPPFAPNTLPVPRGPFWAVGVRVENDVILFDPWRGKAFPEPLSKLRTNPESLKDWFAEKEPVSPLTPDMVKNASAFLSVPASALSPRMAFFEEKLKSETGATVAVNAAALLERIRKAVPAGTGVAFWNPPVSDHFAYVRTLAEFLPIGEGGRDRVTDQTRIFTQYQHAMLPESVLQLPRFGAAAAVMRLRIMALSVYEAAFFVPPTPRERLQRGQFQEAASFLNDKQGGFAKGQERLRQAQSNPAHLFEWIQRAEKVYDDLNRARRPNVGGPPLPDTHPDVAEAHAQVEAFWRNEGQIAQIIVDRATVQAGLIESTFLLALCKHEDAEQAQLRADMATGTNAAREKERAVAAWGEAAGLWRSYLNQVAGQDPFPRRVEHSRTLANRAGEYANKK